jgi:uncharacterized metal-binding protein YceD (DUF177 family)
MSSPEFSRPLSVDTIGEAGRRLTVEADANERAALAKRFGLKAVGALSATFTVSRRSGAPYVDGRVTADVIQSCVVTDEPLPAHVDEAVAIRFLHGDEAQGGDDEVELEAHDCDTVFYQGSAIDLGEAAAESMALALDPFPRGPNADAVLKEAGVLSEGEAGPFGALAALKEQLSKK